MKLEFVRSFLFACILGAWTCLADSEPFGWMTRCGTNQIEFVNAPVNYVGGRSGVVTNNVNGGIGLLSMGIDNQGVSPGLENLLEEPDWSRIRELARGLDYDWRKCYKFVYDNITFAPYYGILRGPERTLLDREGNDADQAFLLLALLQASGHQVWFTNVDGVPSIVTDHFWVNLTIDGVSYDLDPSFKPTRRSEGRDFFHEMGYSSADLVSAAGGIVDGNSVRSVSQSGLDGMLDSYVATLGAAWTNSNTSISDYITTSAITPHDGETYFNGDIFSQEPDDFLQYGTSEQNAFRAKVTITHESLSKSFFLDEIATRRLWLSYTPVNKVILY